MTVAELWVIFKGVGSVVGIFITLITFFGLISLVETIDKSISSSKERSNLSLSLLEEDILIKFSFRFKIY